VSKDEPVRPRVLLDRSDQEPFGEQQIHRDAKLIAIGVGQPAQCEERVNHDHAS
jgi:hypothetical protein